MTLSSAELIPLSYARTVHNQTHGTEFQSHTNLLTAEQAQQINGHFDIEVHTGVHGFSMDALAAMGVKSDMHLGLPTQKEYAQAAEIVQDMQVGDTLFVERFGFSRPQESSVSPNVAALLEQATSGSFPKDLGEVALIGLETLITMRENLELARQNYNIDAWDYAVQLARLKGIAVKYADTDMIEGDAQHAVAQGRTIA